MITISHPHDVRWVVIPDDGSHHRISGGEIRTLYDLDSDVNWDR